MLNFARLSPAIFAVVLCIAPAAFAKEEVTHGTVNIKMGYQSTSSGDPLTGSGAQVTISAERAEEAASGGIIYTTSSQGWINKVARLSAVVHTTSSNKKPSIWLRADGSSGKPLKFASSAGSEIPADGRLSIDLRIPADATRVVFGVVMRGSGKTTAEDLRLVESDRVPPGNEASARQVYDEAVKVVLEHAYWSSNLDKSQRELKPDLSSDPGSGYQAEGAIRALLRELKDSHSFYVGAEEAHSYSISGGDAGSAEVKLIDGKVGYVLVPAVRGTNPALAKEFATEVGGELKGVSEGARCGWVVDLRKNSGGNMWPMVSALSIFFGSERLGGFKEPNGEIKWWSIQSPSVTAVRGASEAKNAKIAVLLGPKTSSSGEAMAVAFVGRENTRSFGAPSSGRASANSKFDLPDGSGIYLTTAVDVDRSGKEVGERIVPDMRLPDDVVSGNEVPEEALSWLTSSCNE